MSNVKTVLADVDPGDGEQLGIERARQLAAASGASVYLLLTACDQSLTGGVLSDRESLKQAREDYLAELRGRLERLLVGSTAERLLDDVDCDVVVIKPDAFPSR